ncbi:hypothetical protein [Pelosinus sp. sgz500959]|uniref:hypothetical protein n=1 Tax=Pelosinus sp. sgz500959 TaxID=3242472 RepID=UPI003673617A
MKATVNRRLFIERISPVPAAKGVSMLIADGILSAVSLGQGITARISVYALKDGQVFLNGDEWNNLISKIETYQESYIDIDI